MNLALIFGGVILAIVVIGYLLRSRENFGYSSQSESIDKLKLLEKKIKTMEQEEVLNCLYLSELSSLIDKYNLSYDKSDIFFTIVNNIIKEGKNFAIDKITNVLSREEDPRSKAEHFFDVIKELKEGDFKMNIEWGNIDKNSLKVFPQALQDWAREFNLYDELNKNPRETMRKILNEELYNFGIKSILDEIKVKSEVLQEEVKEENWQRVEELFNEITKKISKN